MVNDPKEKKPVVSIVIPSYNGANVIKDALDCVVSQTYSDWECIIVDDGSTDLTKEIIQPFLDADRRFRYILKERNEGLPRARNTGIKNSQGEFIAFLDNDDIWLPEKLFKQVSSLIMEPEAGLCCTYFEIVNQELEIMYNWQQINEKVCKYPDEITADKLMYYCCVPGSSSSSIVRKECFGVVGDFDVNLGWDEDRDMWFRIALKYKIIIEKEVLVRLRRRNNPSCYHPKAIYSALFKFYKKVKYICPEKMGSRRKYKYNVMINCLINMKVHTKNAKKVRKKDYWLRRIYVIVFLLWTILLFPNWILNTLFHFNKY